MVADGTVADETQSPVAAATREHLGGPTGDLPGRLGFAAGDRRRLVHVATALYLEGRVEPAERIFRGLVALYPERGELWSALGAALLRRERFAEAHAVLARAIRLAPDDLAARVNHAECAVALARVEEAAEDLAFVLGRDRAGVSPLGQRARQMAISLYLCHRRASGTAA